MTLSTPRKWGVVEEIKHDSSLTVDRIFLEDDQGFPNNQDHPLLIFRKAFVDGSYDQGSEKLMQQGWTRPWIWDIFTCHLYHSNAWEVLVCMKGQAQVQFGGPSGPTLPFEEGDVALVPPGVAHKQVSSQNEFQVLGSYPKTAPQFDNVRREPTKQQRRNILNCETPIREPITQIKLSDLYS
jgi:uncharacterized protein YjlB